MAVIDTVKGRVTEYDEKAGELVIRVPYSDIPTLIRRGYKTCTVQLEDSRPLSSQQRKACYSMIAAVAEFAGEMKESTKEFLKFEFWTTELYQTADTMFSLSNAPMSIVAAFQKWLARFIVSNEIPCKFSLLDYVDDVSDYIYACLINKKCCICGKKADLHHVDRVGMGRDRTEIVHEGMRVLPLCREHHQETHTMPDAEFFGKYHINDGIVADKTICRMYRLKENKNAEQN